MLKLETWLLWSCSAGDRAIPVDPDGPTDPLLFRLACSSEQTEKLVTSLGAPAVVIELRHQVFALS